MNWYKMNIGTLINLERIITIYREGKAIYFDTELQERFVETFETEEEEEEKFKRISWVLQDEIFINY